MNGIQPNGFLNGMELLITAAQMSTPTVHSSTLSEQSTASTSSSSTPNLYPSATFSYPAAATISDLQVMQMYLQNLSYFQQSIPPSTQEKPSQNTNKEKEGLPTQEMRSSTGTDESNGSVTKKRKHEDNDSSSISVAQNLPAPEVSAAAQQPLSSVAASFAGAPNHAQMWNVPSYFPPLHMQFNFHASQAMRAMFQQVYGPQQPLPPMPEFTLDATQVAEISSIKGKRHKDDAAADPENLENSEDELENLESLLSCPDSEPKETVRTLTNAFLRLRKAYRRNIKHMQKMGRASDKQMIKIAASQLATFNQAIKEQEMADDLGKAQKEVKKLNDQLEANIKALNANTQNLENEKNKASQLKTKLEKTQKEKQDASKELKEQKEKVEELTKQLEAQEVARQNLGVDLATAKNQIEDMSNYKETIDLTLKETQKQVVTLTAEKEQLAATLKETQKQVVTLTSEKTAAEAKLTNLRQVLSF